ncbi:hypothetical protein ACFQDN_04815 [Pseudomonas asuensis]
MKPFLRIVQNHRLGQWIKQGLSLQRSAEEHDPEQHYPIQTHQSFLDQT